MLALLFAIGAVTAVTLPVLISLRIGKRMQAGPKRVAIFMGIGAAGWLIAKIPKGIILLPMLKARGIPLDADPEMISNLLATDIWFTLVAAAAAGLFEELLKPAGVLLLRDKSATDRPFLLGWIVGLGAGLIEAINFVIGAGITGFAAGGDLAATAVAPYERLAVVAFHGALTSLVVGGWFSRRYVLIVGAIVLHAAVDFFVPLAQLRGILTGTLTIALVMSIIATITVWLALRLAKSNLTTHAAVHM